MRVTARMAEPVVTIGDGLHLDGILALAAYRDLDEEARWALPPIGGDEVVDFDLPLGRWEAAGTWGWLATVALADWSKRSVYEVRKRVPFAEMQRWTKAVSLNASLGPGKAYDLKYPTVWAHTIEWFAIGDLDEVRRLLTSHVVGIGKKVNKGMGRVLEWAVEPAEVDEAYILERRVVACEESEATAWAGVRPPYHHMSRKAWVREPTDASH